MATFTPVSTTRPVDITRVNGYRLFCVFQRKIIMRANPQKVNASFVIKQLGRYWEALSAAEREEWNKKAKNHNEASLLRIKKI